MQEFPTIGDIDTLQIVSIILKQRRQPNFSDCRPKSERGEKNSRHFTCKELKIKVTCFAIINNLFQFCSVSLRNNKSTQIVYSKTFTMETSCTITSSRC